MADVLQVEGVEEEEATECGEGADGGDGGSGERDAAEEPQVDERFGDAPLPQWEGRQGGQGDSGEGEDERGGPAVLRALDDRGGAGAEQDDHQQLPDRVEPAGSGRARLGDVPGGQHAGRQPDRDVDQEDRRPARAVHQEAAEQRAERHADPDDAAPDADGLGALARLGEGVGDDGHGHRVEHRAADRLQRAERDQPPEAGRETARQGAQDEEHQPGLEDPAAADAVGDGAGEHQQRGQHQGVGVDDPLEAGGGGVQILLDRRERDVHDGVVQADDEQAQAADPEDQQPVAAVRLVGAARGGDGFEHLSIIAPVRSGRA